MNSTSDRPGSGSPPVAATPASPTIRQKRSRSPDPPAPGAGCVSPTPHSPAARRVFAWTRFASQGCSYKETRDGAPGRSWPRCVGSLVERRRGFDPESPGLRLASENQAWEGRREREWQRHSRNRGRTQARGLQPPRSGLDRRGGSRTSRLLSENPAISLSSSSLPAGSEDPTEPFVHFPGPRFPRANFTGPGDAPCTPGLFAPFKKISHSFPVIRWGEIAFRGV